MIKIATLFASTALHTVSAVFEPEGAGWKTDADGKIELRDGNPVYVDADGKEQTIAVNAISNLIGENKQYRSRAQAAEQKLEMFKDVDPEAARSALDVVSRLDQKKLLDAGKVDEIKAEIEGRYKSQLSEAQKIAQESQDRINKMTLDNAFTTSKFVNERVAIPADMLVSTFRDNFKIEDGKLVPYGPDGKVVYSNDRIGEVASFDEALSIMIGSRPDKDKLLLAKPANGSGNDGGGGNRGDGRVYSRDDFAKKSPAEQAQIAAQVREGKARLVD